MLICLVSDAYIAKRALSNVAQKNKLLHQVNIHRKIQFGNNIYCVFSNKLNGLIFFEKRVYFI